jgi:hypothetical protein
MQFIITCAHRDTGQPASLTIEAVDQAAAMIAANDMGFVVSSVSVKEAMRDTPPPDLRDQLRVALADREIRRSLGRLVTRSVSEGVLVGIMLVVIFGVVALVVIRQ